MATNEVKKSDSVAPNEVEIVVESVGFRKDNAAFLSYRQVQGGEGPDSEVVERWVFNLPQIASQNGIPSDQFTSENSEMYANTVKERDELGRKIMTAVLAAFSRVDDARKSIADAFTQALPPK